MMKDVIQDALNAQINREMYSSNLYLAMSAYYASINLNGFAHWMRIQAQEEMDHAMKFFDYMIDRGANVVIDKIDAPKLKWDSPLDAFEASFKHEQFISENINKLADIAIKENDYATNNLIQWFVNEQVEEEANVDEIVSRMKMLGGFEGGLFMMDNELKQRVFTQITQTNQ